jgi:hypothetical protein
MAAATVVIAESNGTTPTVTEDPDNLNMGSTEATELDDETYPITAGTNSFEKWVRFHVSNIGTDTKVENLKVWASAAFGTGITHKTNARETSYAGAETFDTGNGPLATDRSATHHYTQTMPTSEPTGANLGIGGALDGELTAAGYSDYLVMQLQTTASAETAAAVTMNFQYDRVA